MELLQKASRRSCSLFQKSRAALCARRIVNVSREAVKEDLA